MKKVKKKKIKVKSISTVNIKWTIDKFEPLGPSWDEFL